MITLEKKQQSRLRKKATNQKLWNDVIIYFFIKNFNPIPVKIFRNRLTTFSFAFVPAETFDLVVQVFLTFTSHVLLFINIDSIYQHTLAQIQV